MPVACKTSAQSRLVGERPSLPPPILMDIGRTFNRSLGRSSSGVVYFPRGHRAVVVRPVKITMAPRVAARPPRRPGAIQHAPDTSAAKEFVRLAAVPCPPDGLTDNETLL